MALTLDPTLASAQESQARHPIVSLTSVSSVAEIPFLGKFLDTVGTAEQKPNVITLSSGALAGVMIYGNAFRFFYTDPDRTEFKSLDIPAPYGYAGEAALVELASGNVGLILYCNYSGSAYERLYRMVVSPEGSIVTAPAQILSYANAAHLLSCPYVIRLANGTYFLCYVHETISGATYAVVKMTSSDFLTWSAESVLSIGGLTSTKRIASPSLLQISGGDIWLWFDYLESTSGANELTNIYFSISGDNGATWAAATQFTNYSTYDTVAKHPVSAQKVANQMHLLFTEVKGVLKMDGTQTGYCGTSKTASSFSAGCLHFVPSTRKLYAFSSAGYAVKAIVRIDVDTWTIDACWGPTSVPAIPAWWMDGGAGIESVRTHNEGDRVALATGYYSTGGIHLTVLDGDSDAFINYDFADWPAEGITRNVNANLDLAYWLVNCWLDDLNNRLYCFLVYEPPPGSPTGYIGYIDLTEAAPGPGEYYTFHDFFKGVQTGANWRDNRSGMSVFPDSDYIVINSGVTGTGGGTTTYQGWMQIFQISTGLLLKTYTPASPGFPTHGVSQCVVRAGKLWCTYTVMNDYGPEWPGLCDIDLTTDVITHHKPTWDPVSDTAGYNFTNILMTPDESTLIFSQPILGMAIYDVASDTWTLHSNDDIAGLDPNPSGRYDASMLAYDEASEMVYFGLAGGSFGGVIGFCINGMIEQTYYEIGTFTDHWTWGDPNPLIRGLKDYEAVAALEPGTMAMYAFWTEKVFPSGNTRIKWGKESASLDLGGYLLKGTDISVHRSIDGTPAQLEFSVSSGHLFDPNNINSLMSIYLEKGRELDLKFGEKISGINYWQNQGSFFVTEAKLSYKRGTYPSMAVVAQDRKVFFEQGLVQASDYYQDYPEPVLQDILKKAFNLVDADFDLPTFDDREIIYQQWIETQAKDIIDQICNRFGYFLRMTADGLVSARKISNANAVDHIYTDGTKLIDFTPDDSFSDFTNQVIAIGHSLIDIPVVYPEERIQTLSGTCGWWGFKRDYNIYYSLDGSKKCQSPRLLILESTQSIMFQFGGQVNESISYIDPNGLYCVVTVTAPDLIPLLISTVAGWALAHAIPDGWGGFVVGGTTIPVGRILEGIAMVATMMILSSVGNFQYEIYAKPVGNVRRMVQYISDDLDLQAKINSVITKKFEEPLAYSESQCKVCADHELMVFQAQRKRVTFEKVADLREEDGDTIQIPHPYSGAATKVFITEITRKMMIPGEAGSEGHFTDSISGWNVT
jgi:hypothetical protein